jgi:hypothetical protein
LRAHRDAIGGGDFFTTEVWTWEGLVTYYTLFVIDLASRRAQIAGSTRPPDEMSNLMIGLLRVMSRRGGGSMHLGSAAVLSLVLSTTVLFHQPRSSAVTRLPGERPAPGLSEAAAEVLAFEREMEAAVVRGDIAYLEKIIPGDFSFTHGDGWTTGGAPLRVDDKRSWLESIRSQPYLARDLDDVKVELHDDIAITYGRYVAKNRSGAPDRRQFTVWFERVYARRGGHWQFLSHRTVRGPTYVRQ